MKEIKHKDGGNKSLRVDGVLSDRDNRIIRRRQGLKAAESKKEVAFRI